MGEGRLKRGAVDAEGRQYATLRHSWWTVDREDGRLSISGTGWTVDRELVFSI